MKKIITVELNDKQQKMFDEWKSHLKSLYGEYGLLTWKITPNGIGEEIVGYGDILATVLGGASLTLIIRLGADK